MENLDLGFPLWIRLTHFFNILFLSLLIRSGIEILGGHPMLYWNDHSTPGSEWVRFTPEADAGRPSYGRPRTRSSRTARWSRCPVATISDWAATGTSPHWPAGS